MDMGSGKGKVAGIDTGELIGDGSAFIHRNRVALGLGGDSSIVGLDGGVVGGGVAGRGCVIG